MDIVCVSHLRWDFVFQRPQHLLSRAARDGRVFYVEECTEGEGPARLQVSLRRDGLAVVTPTVPAAMPMVERAQVVSAQLQALLREQQVTDYLLWYYTPMALPFTAGLAPALTVYDCMDELSAFAGAPRELVERERELFRAADLVFTGGQTLFEAKRAHHRSVHAFPSSVDVPHFARARRASDDPPDQRAIPHPRIGFFGVIDERMDYPLLAGVAAARPDWHFVLIGPTAKVDPATLPRAANLHYLGAKDYAELPSYIARWDVAMLPFARNEATRFISPTKTPEYLAAGRPVVSTSIRDVVRPYGQQGLARIADTVADFVAAIEASLADDPIERLRAADAFLTHLSWDGTWARMQALIAQTLALREDPASRAVSAS